MTISRLVSDISSRFSLLALILKPRKRFALKMHEKYKFEDFLIKVFKWFINRKERDEDGNPLVDDSPMVRSINLLNIVADKLMGNSPTLCSAVIKNTGMLFYAIENIARPMS